jgi:hypothetical protein
MIEYYFNYSLFPDLDYLLVGWAENLNYHNAVSFQGELVELLEVIDQDNSNWILYNPQNTLYNVLVGYTESNELVFIYGISIYIIDSVTLTAIQFNLHRRLVEDSNVINVNEYIIYGPHAHPNALNNPQSSTEISKVSNYQNELLNDGLVFSKNHIILRNLPIVPINGCKVLHGGSPVDIDEIEGVYGVDFRFEALPSEIKPKIPKNATHFTYRGSAVCYKISSTEYHILTNKDSVFNQPITLINEFYAVMSDGRVLMWDSINLPNVGWVYDWISVTGIKEINLVCYRAGFINFNNSMTRVI